MILKAVKTKSPPALKQGGNEAANRREEPSQGGLNWSARRVGMPWRTPRDDGYSDEWYSPVDLVSRLGLFDLDPCAARESDVNLARENYRLPSDGLLLPWVGRVWLNPPYSSIKKWIPKMVAHGDGVAFLNAWTQRDWFQFALEHSSAVLFTRPTIHCARPIGPKSGSPQGNALLAFGDTNAKALMCSGITGTLFIGRVFRLKHKSRRREL